MITPETIKDIFNKFIIKIDQGDRIYLQTQFNNAENYKSQIKILNQLKDYLKYK